MRIPVIAHGGAGKFNHVFEVINQTDISGVSISGFFITIFVQLLNLKKLVGNIHYLKNIKKRNPKNLLYNLKNTY